MDDSFLVWFSKQQRNRFRGAHCLSCKSVKELSFVNWDVGGGSFASVSVCNELVGFVGVPVGVSSCWQCPGSLLLMIVSLCLHPRVALLGSGRCWIAHCWIGLRIELPCHYYSHGTTGIIAACWNAKSSQYSNWQVNSGINVSSLFYFFTQEQIINLF